MPELPEVETIVRQLGPLVTGRKVASLEIFDQKLDSMDNESVPGRTVLEVRRLGKQIGIHLSGCPRTASALWLCFHLRMTGRLIWDDCCQTQNRKYLRAKLVLDKGELSFYDMRRFGSLKSYHSMAESLPAGLDPLSPEFAPSKLEKMLAHSRQEIKSWLLRQDRLAGLGNIYASEILFAAGINPRRQAGSLNSREINCLHSKIVEVLRLAIENCGTTFADFQDTRGQTGSFQGLLAVYGRQGDPCPKCGKPIVRIVQQQRSTFFCPDDQE
ncbi:MAG TPA: bifunctional DNA-formamidopyrimidine glycosylase/DNA-(apurinic or apyrimidinic site) lyase [archaeon]|nr:bifunctional DNA-formamidopyrimidine glycosylase/DNA-(apurinic or apyrimidinic site) lyase [archaeon]